MHTITLNWISLRWTWESKEKNTTTLLRIPRLNYSWLLIRRTGRDWILFHGKEIYSLLLLMCFLQNKLPDWIFASFNILSRIFRQFAESIVARRWYNEYILTLRNKTIETEPADIWLITRSTEQKARYLTW